MHTFFKKENNFSLIGQLLLKFAQMKRYNFSRHYMQTTQLSCKNKQYILKNI